MRNPIVIAAFILSTLCGLAQDTRHSVYYEFAGAGGIGSVNYEYLYVQYGQFQFSPSLGIGSVNLKDFRNKFNPDITMPLNLHFSYGKRHQAEVLIGYTHASSVYANTELKPERAVHSNGQFGVGYCYRAMHTGFYGRLTYYGLWERFSSYRNWGGISLGITF